LRRASDIDQGGLFFPLQAYQYHVFLNWRELRASSEYPWDRLHDWLAGAGVPNLDDALDQLRLQPLHDALRATLDAGILANIIDAAEMPASGAIEMRQRERLILDAVGPFLDRANRFQHLARELDRERGPATTTARTPGGPQQDSAVLVAALSLPRYEPLFPGGWPKTARKVLPSDSPGTSGVTVWAPVLSWALLRGLEFGGSAVFDRLKFRQALGHAFQSLGMLGDDGWRAAARVRFLLHRQNPEALELSAEEWQDPDVLWLTGTHTSEGVRYINQESHEEMLWWIQIPTLTAAPPREQREVARASAAAVQSAMQAAKAAGYRLDHMLAQSFRQSTSGTTTAAPQGKPVSAKDAPKTAPNSAKPGSTAKEPAKAGRNGSSVPTKQSPAKKQPAKKQSPAKKDPKQT
jgi:hypothetical protein